MATTIPKKLYVTIQYRKDASEGLLGFASPYTKDASFEKRKATQDQWAYGYGAKFTIDADDEVFGEFDYNENHRGTQYDALMLLAAGCYPKILDNVPLEGFEISKNVRRSGGWSGAGNVLWRIADPRGYELEISSENLAKILDCVTIVDGVIQGKCTWGRDGSKNILLPEASAPYQEATALTELIDANITIKDITPGDTVELLNTNIAKGTYIYMGAFKVYTTSNEKSEDNSRYNIPGLTHLVTKGATRHIFKDTVKGKYSTTSTPKIAKILTKTTQALDATATALEIMQTCDGDIDNIYDVITLVIDSKKTFSKDKLSFKLVDSEYKYTGGSFPVLGKYSSIGELFFTEVDNKLYASSNESSYGYNNGTREYKPELTEVVANELEKGTLRLVGTLQSSGSYWHKVTNLITKKIVPDDTMTFKKLVVVYDGVDYTIKQAGYLR